MQATIHSQQQNNRLELPRLLNNDWEWGNFWGCLATAALREKLVKQKIEELTEVLEQNIMT